MVMVLHDKRIPPPNAKVKPPRIVGAKRPVPGRGRPRPLSWLAPWAGPDMPNSCRCLWLLLVAGAVATPGRSDDWPSAVTTVAVGRTGERGIRGTIGVVMRGAALDAGWPEMS